MEEQFYGDRAALRRLLHTHPEWTQRDLATHLGRSVACVKTWARRLRAAAPDDTGVLWSRSRAHRALSPLG